VTTDVPILLISSGYDAQTPRASLKRPWVR
jgi:hypothetical protein